MNVRMIGLGESFPDPKEMINNDEVLERLRQHGVDTKGKTGKDTEDLIGIATRWHSTLTSSEHAIRAAKEACKDAAVKTNGVFDPSKLELIHSGGSSPDWVFPACACEIHGALGIPTGNCEARDISLACSSFVDALILAASRIRDKKMRYGLVSVGEAIGTRLNAPTSLNHCLWGDGGGAVVLEMDPEGDPNKGIIADKAIADGQYEHWTRSRGLGLHPENNPLHRDSSMESHEKDIHRYGVSAVSKVLENFLDEVGIEGEYPYLLPHNANLKMVLAIGNRIGLRPDRILTRIAERGNTSSASIPITLAHYARMGKFKEGDLLILLAFGGGMAIDIALICW